MLIQILIDTEFNLLLKLLYNQTLAVPADGFKNPPVGLCSPEVGFFNTPVSFFNPGFWTSGFLRPGFWIAGFLRPGLDVKMVLASDGFTNPFFWRLAGFCNKYAIKFWKKIHILAKTKLLWLDNGKQFVNKNIWK